MSYYNVYTGLLRSFDEMSHGNNSFNGFTYDFSHSSYHALRQKYNLDQIAGDGGELDQSIKIMNWLFKHTYYKGESGNTFTKQNALDILAYAYDKNTAEFGINCLALGITLAECLQSLQIYAKVVSMNPLSPYDLDNHIVVQVYLKEEKRWVMLDPTYNTYVMDGNGRLLSLLDLRDTLAKQETIEFGPHLNESSVEEVDTEQLVSYYAKNSFYFRSSPIQFFGSHEMRNNYLEFIPIGFDVKERTINYFKFLKKKIGNDTYFDKVIKEIEEESILLGDYELLEDEIV